MPSRLQPGSVYALPQSPQQMKQLLMVSGFDRYFQIARCLRDEDLRGDRQPEFTQLDLEMSFVDRGRRHGLGRADGARRDPRRGPRRPLLNEPFPRFTYREAIDRFGSDKPDVRYGMELHDLGDLAAASGFRVFESVLADGGRVFGFAATGMGGSYASPDRRADRAGPEGRRRWASCGWPSTARAVSAARSSRSWARTWRASWPHAAGGQAGDLVLIVADADITAQEVLGSLRVETGRSQRRL